MNGKQSSILILSKYMSGLVARRPPSSEAGAEGGGEEKRGRLVGSAPPPWGFLVCLKKGGGPAALEGGLGAPPLATSGLARSRLPARRHSY